MGSQQFNEYPLSHTRDELDRLVQQGRFFGDLTEYVLRQAGIGPGMRVLDAGCGAGDVSFLAAKLVGPEGAVIGVDKSGEAIAFARQRAQAAGLSNVQFIAADLADFQLEGKPVDALTGRLVLMYFPDPAGVLRRLLAFVKAGGIVVFQELDLLPSPPPDLLSQPVCETYVAAGTRIIQTFARAGVDVRTAVKLSPIFQRAGLPAPQMLALQRVERGADASIYEWIAQTTRTLLPLMQQTGVATAEEVQVDTLAERMRREAVEKDCTLMTPPLIAAWARKPHLSTEGQG
ncbi:MAG: class I SAM-dependent methyltransferase [Armatimonadota bacterium]|nr:class I SAM-dependent methyltransferase [Armatimonadota bacterium]